MSLGINQVVVDPEQPGHLYTGTTSGLYESADRGVSWTKTGAGLGEPFVTAVAFTRSTPRRVYAGTNRGLYQSVNDGERWEKVFSGEIRAITTDPLRTERVYIGTPAGLFRSDGADWTAVGIPR
jgi:hypothetical protein